MKATINAKGTEITVLSKGDENDFISLTDILPATRILMNPRMLLRIGCVAEAPSNFWGSGNS